MPSPNLNQSEPTGLIISLPEPIIDRLFHHRDVYVHPDRAASFLNVGNRIFFYDTISRRLMGEAVVSKMALERWDRISSQYGQHLFLSPEELDQYAREKGLNRDEPLIVLELEDAIKYMNPMKCPISVPDSGLRVTRAVFDEITRANR